MSTQTTDPTWAWQPYRSSAENPWNLKKVGHLHRRASFGATQAELRRGLEQGPDAAISALLRGGEGQEAFDRETADRIPSIVNVNDGQLASAWWLYRMLYTPHPLKEKLTLFWHNHFATSNRKVNNAGFTLGQYELLHRHAQGNFRTLLEEISQDPAMIVWLDTNQSQRNQPNENYARELMELFSLGINDPTHPGRRNYTEQDVRQAARAFTGWRLEAGRAVFREADHDPGEKTVLGQTGRWKGNDIVRICLEQPASTYFLVGKLYRFLISETVPATPALLEPLATEFRRSGFDFGALVERMLRSNLFFAPEIYRSRVKSPIDFSLGIVRALEGRIGTAQLVQALEGLGQRPFYPPSVAGWDGGRAWLNGQTLLFRQNLALALTSAQDDRFGERADPIRIARREPRNDEQLVDFFLELFLQNDVPAEARERLLQYRRESAQHHVPSYWSPRDAEDQRIRALCHLVLTQPEFQLD